MIITIFKTHTPSLFGAASVHRALETSAFLFLIFSVVVARRLFAVCFSISNNKRLFLCLFFFHFKKALLKLLLPVDCRMCFICIPHHQTSYTKLHTACASFSTFNFRQVLSVLFSARAVIVFCGVLKTTNHLSRRATVSILSAEKTASDVLCVCVD